MTAEPVQKQRGRPWARGISGNPRGRAPGCRNRATVAAQALLDGEAEALTRKAVELALRGDPTALRLCLERVLPARKGRPVELALPAIATAADVLTAQAAVIAAMAGGEVTPDEAAVIAGVLEAKRKALETVELEQRLGALEAAAATDGMPRR